MSQQVCSCCGWSKVTTYHGLRTHQGKMGCTPKGMRIPESQQFGFSSYVPKYTFIGSPIRVEEPLTDIFTPSLNSVFRTPQSSYETTTKVRRALEFSTGAQQVGQLVWNFPRITEVQPEETERERERARELERERARELERERARELERERERERVRELERERARELERERARELERQREREREAQKLLKARQDRTRADLQQKIRMREQNMVEVISSVEACQGSLKSEWLEINNVFSEVMRVVEDARQEALQPLEERTSRVKREGQHLVKKLQKEINKLKEEIDELDLNPDLQFSPLAALGGSEDWKTVTVDTSFCFGTLRSTTSNMIKRIHQELEKLSSVELRRTPSFAVDVKLDPTTAHQWLVLSPDGKKVKDGGKSQKVPDAPERFDMFASILGTNRLTSKKSYWEVEVSNKTGWDLGVARRDANRRGKLSLNPDNGYWVTVHYEDDKYAALTAPPVCLSLKVKPQKVGVFVDYEEGLVSFYDVMAQSHIYSFTECSFRGEIFPYFSPHLEQNGKNSDPLIISAVRKQK